MNAWWEAQRAGQLRPKLRANVWLDEAEAAGPEAYDFEVEVAADWALDRQRYWGVRQIREVETFLLGAPLG